MIHTARAAAIQAPATWCDTPRVAGYVPQAQGAGYVIDFSEGGIALQPVAVTYSHALWPPAGRLQRGHARVLRLSG